MTTYRDGDHLGNAVRQESAIGADNRVSGGRAGDKDDNHHQRQGSKAGERPAHGSHRGRRISPKTSRQPDSVDCTQHHRRQDEHTVNQASHDEGDDTIRRTEVDTVHSGTNHPQAGEFKHNGKYGRCDQDAPTATHDESGQHADSEGDRH